MATDDHSHRDEVDSSGATQLATTGAPVSGDDPTAAGAAPQTAEPPSSLVEIDPKLYAIGIEIARGGMGRVFAARDRKLHRDVVIKVLRDGAYRARFEREALITARLQHPSIVRVYDAGKLGDEPFYAMEYVRGKTLDRAVAETEDTGARLALLPRVIAVVEALAYAHSQQIIHRDLKPANILIGDFGETVVIDWGLAKDLTADDSLDPDRRVPGPREPTPPLASDLTVAGAVMGTPAYMPPEQARGERASERSDVYALGAILYTVLAGAPPLVGERALDDARAGGITPLGERAPDVPDELVTIVEHAMAFDASDRYATARELAEDLRKYAAGELVKRHSYSRGELAMRWLKRYRAPLAIFGFAAIASAAVWLTLEVRALARERADATERADQLANALHTAEQRSDQFVIRRAEEWSEQDPTWALGWLRTLSPTGLASPQAHVLAGRLADRGVAFELYGLREPAAHLVAGNGTTAYIATASGELWRSQLATFRVDRLAAHRGEITATAVSSDRFWLATGGVDHTVMLWDLEQVQQRTLTGHRGAVRGVAFSPDGSTLASIGDDRGLWLWTVATGNGRSAWLAEVGLRALAWTADGKAVVLGTEDGRLIEFAVATARPRAIHPATGSAIHQLAVSPTGDWIGELRERGVVAISSRSGQPVATGEATAVRHLAWRADRLITVGGDGLAVFEPTTGRRRVVSTPSSISAFAVDEHLIAAAVGDGKIAVWSDLEQAPRTLRSLAVIGALAIARDGKAIISADTSGGLRWWPVTAPPPVPDTIAGFAEWMSSRTNVDASARTIR